MKTKREIVKVALEFRRDDLLGRLKIGISKQEYAEINEEINQLNNIIRELL